jgi:hypothetical protein
MDLRKRKDLRVSAISRRNLLTSLLALPALSRADDGWVPLFDGASLDGWKSGEDVESFKVVDGLLVAEGPRAHLFYSGSVGHADFKNFELKADVMSTAGSRSAICFHTASGRGDRPSRGLEVAIANAGVAGEHRKTGSLYGVRNVYKALVKDDQWFQVHLTTRGKQVQIRLNGVLVVDYVEPQTPVRIAHEPERALGHGTFALRCDGPNSKVLFRNILVRQLADAAPAVDPPVVDEIYRGLAEMSARNFPLVDSHVHLKGGLTIEEALRESRRLGIGYGVAINVGLGFPTTTDAAAEEYLRSMQGQPCYAALQGEGREWVTLVSKETIAKFDYVFTDCMTFTDDNGKRMRTWITEEVGEIPDAQRFMDTLVSRILGILEHEPIDIYANPTFLPAAIAGDYDRLWTAERMRKVIQALKKNNVAMEINNSRRLPSPAFIKAAKKAGVKFSFGTNNSGKELGRLEYGVQMVKECGLTWQDFFVPRPDGQKPAQKL